MLRIITLSYNELNNIKLHFHLSSYLSNYVVNPHETDMHAGMKLFPYSIDSSKEVETITGCMQAFEKKFPDFP